MSKLRKFYYDNKNQIWKDILIIVSILFVIQIINYRLKITRNKETNNIVNNNVINNNTNISNGNNAITIKQESLIDSSNVKEETIKEEAKIIKNFFNYCIEGQKQEAYNLLSKDCKEELYIDLSKFEERYINNILFESTQNVINIENWLSNIYRVTITEDIMATGNLNNQSIQDYITVVNENGESKLNINSFIGKESINKAVTQDGINISIATRKIFMDYEEYEIKIDNNTENTILLDTKQSTKSIYLIDENNIKYYSQSHELLDGLLKVKDGFSSQITVRFTKVHSNKSCLKSLVFSDVRLNYNEYLNANKEAQTITINI